MMSTGIVRRIDDMGRVVIPKELRDRLKLVNGSPLELFMNENGEIILRKFVLSDKDEIVEKLSKIKERLDTDPVLDMDINCLSQHWSKDIQEAVDYLLKSE